MSELRDLYQEVILDHSKHPRNRRKPDAFTQKAEGYNPLCGDRVTVYLDLRAGIIEDVAFEGSGCAISTASASLMTQALKGRPVDEVRKLFQRFHELLTGSGEPSPDLGKLAAFSGVREFPVRVKCATLGWHTLKAALENIPREVTTE
jgi:nitrogen fixation NifU-like protein